MTVQFQMVCEIKSGMLLRQYVGHFFKLNFIKANFIKVKAAGPLQPRLRVFVLIEVYDPYTNDFNLRCFSFTEV